MTTDTYAALKRHIERTNMAAPTRIYVVFENGQPAALVRAQSQAAAIRHCTLDRFDARVADQDDIVKMMQAGVQVVDAVATLQVAGEAA